MSIIPRGHAFPRRTSVYFIHMSRFMSRRMLAAEMTSGSALARRAPRSLGAAILGASQHRGLSTIKYETLAQPAPGSVFHHAFPVHDLEAAKAFYGGVLGCAEGRSSIKWQDYSLHGHQIVAVSASSKRGRLHHSPAVSRAVSLTARSRHPQHYAALGRRRLPVPRLLQSGGWRRGQSVRSVRGPPHSRAGSCLRLRRRSSTAFQSTDASAVFWGARRFRCRTLASP